MKRDRLGLGFAITSFVTALIPYLILIFVYVYVKSQTYHGFSPAITFLDMALSYEAFFGFLACIVSIVFGILGIVKSTRKVAKGLSIAGLAIAAPPTLYIGFYLVFSTSFLFCW